MTDQQLEQLLTGDDLLELPHGMGERYELIEGRLIAMPPTNLEHGTNEFGVAFQLGLFNKQRKLGRVMTGEPGFYTRGDKHTVRAADVAFISYERLPAGPLEKGFSHVPPELVVEIVSPNDKADEIEAKVREWLQFGVRLVWVVYPEARRVHVYTTPDHARILEAQDTIDGSAVLPGFSALVSAFFED